MDGMIKDLFTNNSCWTQHANARDEFNIPIDIDSPRAKCWCLAGAMDKEYPNDEERTTVRNKIRNDLGTSFVGWNDHPYRTFEQVKALVEKLNV